MKCGCNKDKDGIDTDVLKIIPQDLFDIIGSKIGLSKGTKYNDEVKDSLKKDAENKGVRLREYLTENPLVSKQITIIENMKKFQFGGLMTRVDSTERIKDLNSDIQRTINPMLRDNSKVMQKGGQMNQEQMQQKFVQWLASKLGAKSQEELQAKVKQLGEAGMKKAQQQFMQEIQGQGGVMSSITKNKKGGLFNFIKK